MKYEKHVHRTSDKGLLSKIYKYLTMIDNKTNNTMKQLGKVSEQQFYQRHTLSIRYMNV